MEREYELLLMEERGPAGGAQLQEREEGQVCTDVCEGCPVRTFLDRQNAIDAGSFVRAKRNSLARTAEHNFKLNVLSIQEPQQLYTVSLSAQAKSLEQMHRRVPSCPHLSEELRRRCAKLLGGAAKSLEQQFRSNQA